MINGSGHDHTLDWWALGVLIYEMIIGIPPFYHQNKHKMYYLIEHADIRWPDQEKHGISISDTAKDLITKLLAKDKKSRLGQNGDDEEVLSHPWFASLDKAKVLSKEMTPPFIPKVETETDTSNFDQRFTTQEVSESVVDVEKQQLIDKHKEDFETF